MAGPAGPKRGFFSRSRSLADFNRKFSKNIIEKTIKNALKSNKKVRVLEIGCGEGRVLMELRKMFPQVELHGINKKPWMAMKGEQSLKRTGTYYKIFKRSEITRIKLPKIYFYSIEKLKFKDNFFDLVISQVSIQYIPRKDKVLEEVWRVLKSGGKAFLNIDTAQDNFPDFLNYTTPRFIIYKEGKIYPVKRLIRDLKNKGYDISYTTSCSKESGMVKERVNLIMYKNKHCELKLNLNFDETSSFDLRLLKKEIEGSPVMGYRSVFRI